MPATPIGCSANRVQTSSWCAGLGLLMAGPRRRRVAAMADILLAMIGSHTDYHACVLCRSGVLGVNVFCRTQEEAPFVLHVLSA